VFIAEAQAMGLRIEPPNINRGSARFSPDGEAIHYGLAGMKNVGSGAAAAVVAERQRGGPYEGLIDFCSRVDPQAVNKKVIESLVRCGAFDDCGTHRARLFNGIDFAMSRAASALRDRQAGQGSLFNLMADSPDGGDASSDDELPDCPEWHENELLAGERELLGMYMTGHPLSQYTWLLEKYQLAGITDLANLADHTETRVGGIVGKLTKRVTRTSKETMAVIGLEDLDGIVEVLVFPEAYQRCGAEIEQDAAILVCGEVSRREEQPKIIAQEIYRLADAPRHFTQRVGIHLPVASMDDNKLTRLHDIIRMHPGLVPVVICLQFPTGEKVFIQVDDACRVQPSQEMIQEIEHAFGERTVYVAVKPDACLKPRQNRRQWNGNGR
jgi:DNA polymerase-3 subunit alpha